MGAVLAALRTVSFATSTTIPAMTATPATAPTATPATLRGVQKASTPVSTGGCTAMVALSTQQTYPVYAHRYVMYVTSDLSCVGASEATEAPCNDSAANCTGAQCRLVKCSARQSQQHSTQRNALEEQRCVAWGQVRALETGGLRSARSRTPHTPGRCGRSLRCSTHSRHPAFVPDPRCLHVAQHSVCNQATNTG